MVTPVNEYRDEGFTAAVPDDLTEFQPAQVSEKTGKWSTVVPDLTDFVPVPQKSVSVYDEGTRDVTKYPAGLSEGEMDYAYQTQVAKKPRGNFFGLADLGTGFAKGAARFFHDAAVNVSARTIDQLSADVNTVVVENGGLPLPLSPADIGTNLAFRLTGQRYNRDTVKLLQGQADQIRSDAQGRLKRLGWEIEEGEELGAAAGGAVSSLFTSIGLAYLTKNVLLTAAAFTNISNADTFEEARAKGLSVGEATKIASLDSVPQFALEFVGLHSFLNLAKASKPLTRFLLRGGVEGLQEGSQQGANEFVTRVTGLRDDPLKDVAKRIGLAGVLGFVTGGAADVVVSRLQQSGEIRTLETELGITTKDARTLAKAIVTSQQEDRRVQTALIDQLNQIHDKAVSDPHVDSVEDMVAEKVKTERERAAKESETGEMPPLKQIKIVKAAGSTPPKRVEPVSIPQAATVEPPTPTPTPAIVPPALTKQVQQDILAGNVNFLDQQRKVANQRLADLDKQIETAREKGRATKRLEAQREGVRRQASSTATRLVEIAIFVPKTTIQQRSKFLADTRRVVSTIEKQVRAAVRAGTQSIKAAEKVVRQNIRAAQKELVRVIKESGLTPKEQATFLNALVGIDSPARLAKQAQAIENRIQVLLEKRVRKQLISLTKKLLKAARPRVVNGVPVGRFDADTQQEISLIENAVGLTGVERSTALSQFVESAITKGDLSVQDKRRAGIIEAFGGLDSRPLQDVAVAVSEIINTVTEGKSSRNAQLAREAKEREALVERAVRTVQGDKPLTADQAPLEGIAAIADKILKTVNSFSSGLSGWADVLNIFSQDDRASKSFESALNKDLDVTNAELTEKGGVRRRSEKIRDIFTKATGNSDEKTIIKKFREDAKPQNLGSFVDASGQSVNITISIAEARYIEALSRNSDVVASMRDPNQGVELNGIHIKGLTDAISAEIQGVLVEDIDSDVVDGLLDFYRDYYPDINAQFRKRTGVDLPKVDAYIPTSRRRPTYDVSTLDPFLQDQFQLSSNTPSAVKARIPNTNSPIKIKGDVEVAQRYIVQAENYIAWTDTLRRIRTVFGNTEFRSLAKRKFGDGGLKIADGFITTFTEAGRTRAQLFEGVVNMLRINFVVSSIAGSPAIGIKQLVSTLAYAEKTPSADLIKGLFDYVQNRQKAVEILSESEFVKNRGYTFDRDVRDASFNESFSIFRRSPTFKNALLLFTRLGDKEAILAGGWAHYQYVLKETGDKAKALRSFEKLSNATQQSSDLSQLSEIQRGGPWQRLFTMFMTSQNQYLRREMAAIRDGFKGRIPPKEAARLVAIYHVILPAAFQFVSDGFRFDKEEQIRAATFGSLNGIFILSDILDYVYRGFLNSAFDFSLKQYRPDIPYAQAAQGFSKFFAAFDEEISLEALIEGMSALLRDTGGVATGIPFKRIFSAYEGLGDFADEDFVKGAFRTLGWPASVVEQL